MGSDRTNVARCTREIKFKIATAKTALKKRLFHSKLDLKLRKNPVKCYILSVIYFGAETWKFWKVD